jgi:hypothetical protein
MRRSKHNLSHMHLLTSDMGKLVPINVTEVLPGDTVQQHSNVLIRVSPLAAPIYHPVKARVHHFFVPNRLVWDGWEDFITGGPDGNDASTPPQITTTAEEKTLLDYMGVPPVAGVDVSAIPIRAFNLIYNEYYRDQDLVNERLEDDIEVPNIAWEKDYFTSARPWTQKGSDVTIPLGDTAPVLGIGKASNTYTQVDTNNWESGGVGQRTYASSEEIDNASFDTRFRVEEDPERPGQPHIFADLSQAIGANINDVRKAFAIQRYQEARARYGSRYTEYLRYLGVTPTDARLQRPEFLGGGSTMLNFSEILQTSPEANQGGVSEFGVGDLYGHGIAALRSNKYRRFIEEHGYIISLMSVRPHAMYPQGINRTWLRTDKEDFYQRELEHIGQQEVFNNEVYADAADGGQVFGYQDRYMDYRYQQSHVSAEFRDTLNYWHMGREFASTPVLNQSFTDCVPTKRIHNEQNFDALWVMVQNRIVARRLLGKNAAGRIF